MITHELKTWPEYFENVWNGSKTFELRKDDRNFRRGDIVVLREYNPEIRLYTKRSIEAIITYVLKDGEKFGLNTGYCIFSIDVLKNITK